MGMGAAQSYRKSKWLQMEAVYSNTLTSPLICGWSNREKAVAIEFLIQRGNTYDWLTTNPSQQVAVLTFDLPARSSVRRSPQLQNPTIPHQVVQLHSCANSCKAPAATRRCFGQNFLIGNYAGTHLRGSHAGNLFLFCWFIIYARGNEGRERGLPKKLVK